MGNSPSKGLDNDPKQRQRSRYHFKSGHCASCHKDHQGGIYCTVPSKPLAIEVPSRSLFQYDRQDAQKYCPQCHVYYDTASRCSHPSCTGLATRSFGSSQYCDLHYGMMGEMFHRSKEEQRKRSEVDQRRNEFGGRLNRPPSHQGPQIYDRQKETLGGERSRRSLR